MTYADENLQEQETVNESTPSPNVKADSNDDVAQHFICIKEVRPVSRAKALRLKTGDVIVGIEGKTFFGSVEELLDIFDEINEEEGALLTIHDPKVKPYQIKKDLNAYNFIEDPLNMDKLIMIQAIFRGFLIRRNSFEYSSSLPQMFFPIFPHHVLPHQDCHESLRLNRRKYLYIFFALIY